MRKAFKMNKKSPSRVLRIKREGHSTINAAQREKNAFFIMTHFFASCPCVRLNISRDNKIELSHSPRRSDEKILEGQGK